MTQFKWHPNATLTDPSGRTITAKTAAQIPAARCSDPTDPATALPAFFNAISRGQTPIIGPQNTAPDIAGTFLTLTGGTSGRRKTIRRTTQSWLHSIKILQTHLSLSPKATVATLGDLSHSIALYASVEALICGANLHATTPKSVAQTKATHIYATPSQLMMLRTPMPITTHIITGGGPLSPDAAAHIAHMFPNAQITRFYGAAETSFITLATQSAPKASVGPAFPGATLQIRDANNNPVPAPQTGTVWVKSPMLFAGYEDGASPTTQAQNGWLTVGEIGALDADGNLTLLGRADRIVTVADQSIALDQIEQTLTQHPEINAAAVLSAPDKLRGNALYAMVETTAKLDKTAFPALPLKSLRTLPELPRLPSGKTDYITLKRLLS